MNITVKLSHGTCLLEAYGESRQAVLEAHERAFTDDDAATEEVRAMIEARDDPIKLFADREDFIPVVDELDDAMLSWELVGLGVRERADELRERADDLEAVHDRRRPRHS